MERKHKSWEAQYLGIDQKFQELTKNFGIKLLKNRNILLIRKLKLNLSNVFSFTMNIHVIYIYIYIHIIHGYSNRKFHA